MRFPGSPYMDRVIGTANNSLRSFINANVKDKADGVNMIPYYFTAPNTFRVYNDIRAFINADISALTFGATSATGGTVNATFGALSATSTYESVLDPLVQLLTQNFTAGVDVLLAYDGITLREFLSQQGFSSWDIDWLEATNESTFNSAITSLLEAVIDTWIFDAAPLSSWQCVEGGMDRFINGMLKVLKNNVTASTRVVEIKKGHSGTITLVTNNTEETSYAHVISTVTLGALQMIDTTNLSLEYYRKQAIRLLQYQPSEKIGMKFKTRW
jgi:predicted NAD/FAD-binding protein